MLFLLGKNFELCYSLPLAVVNVSVEQRSISISELAGSVQVALLKTDNAVGPVSVVVSTTDGTAQGKCNQL